MNIIGPLTAEIHVFTFYPPKFTVLQRLLCDVSTTQAKNDPVFFVHDEVGYNYRMNNISAALGLSQLKDLNLFIQKKIVIRNIYLKEMKKFKNFKIVKNPNYAINNNWLNILKINNKKKFLRNKIIRKMHKNKIIVRPIWKPNHLLC